MSISARLSICFLPEMRPFEPRWKMPAAASFHGFMLVVTDGHWKRVKRAHGVSRCCRKIVPWTLMGNRPSKVFFIALIMIIVRLSATIGRNDSGSKKISFRILRRTFKMALKILFVCHGNICRSPVAEFVFRDIVKKAGQEADFLIASAATTTGRTPSASRPS